jgi:hypothetical protein
MTKPFEIPKALVLCIPTNPSTHSDRIRPPVPIEFVHPFRANSSRRVGELSFA